MAHTVKDYNRRNITLTTSKVGEVVPEYFGEENSKLIQFLEKYQDFLDSDQANGFGYKIKQLIHARDADRVDEEELDAIIEEIGNGLKSASFFQKPRLMTKLLGDYYRAKGSFNSAQGFFRGFFGLEPEISYPKRDIFKVGESNIGFEAQKFLVNAGIYQVFSILIKCGISTLDYETLYKKFVHPAGFHFAGEVIAVDEGALDVGVPTGEFLIDPLEPDSPDIKVVDQAFVTSLTGFRSDGTVQQDVAPSVPFRELTVLLDSGGDTTYVTNDTYRVDPYGTAITDILTLVSGNLNKFYSNIAEIITPNSFTFDDSDTGASAANARPDFSLTIETMDDDKFTTYLSDSAY